MTDDVVRAIRVSAPAWVNPPSDDPLLLPPGPPMDALLLMAPDVWQALIRRVFGGPEEAGQVANTDHGHFTFMGVPMIEDAKRIPGTWRWEWDGESSDAAL